MEIKCVPYFPTTGMTYSIRERVRFFNFQSNRRTLCEQSSAKVRPCMHPSRLETLKRFCVEIYEFFFNSPYLIFSGQQHNLQLSLTLEIAR